MDEAELIFKRFPEEKQDQIRQLVGYATLMGLTGKDLVSIGGKLDRIKAARERASNLEIIKGFNCLPIGIDSKRRSQLDSCLDERFKLKTANGTYNFQYNYSSWQITSLSTKIQYSHRVDGYQYELGSSINWGRRSRYAVLLDIATGKLVLNF